jgi:hypothetical protein
MERGEYSIDWFYSSECVSFRQSQFISFFKSESFCLSILFSLLIA